MPAFLLPLNPSLLKRGPQGRLIVKLSQPLPAFIGDAPDERRAVLPAESGRLPGLFHMTLPGARPQDLAVPRQGSLMAGHSLSQGRDDGRCRETVWRFHQGAHDAYRASLGHGGQCTRCHRWVQRASYWASWGCMRMFGRNRHAGCGRGACPQCQEGDETRRFKRIEAREVESGISEELAPSGFPVCSPWPADQRSDGGGIEGTPAPAGRYWPGIPHLNLAVSLLARRH